MRSQIPPNRPRSASSFGPAIIIAFVLIMCLALTMGYLVTKHVIYPFILKQDLSKAEDITTPGGIVVDENEIPQAKPSDPNDNITTDGDSPADEQASADNHTPGAVISPPLTSDSSTTGNAPTAAAVYCVQLGNLSTKAAADELVSDLKSKGVTCSVKEINGFFKVLGESYPTKDEARAHLPAISTVVPDAFVTMVQP